MHNKRKSYWKKDTKYLLVLLIKITNDFNETVKIQLQLLDFIKFYDEEIEKEGKLKLINKVSLTRNGKDKLLRLRAVTKK